MKLFLRCGMAAIAVAGLLSLPGSALASAKETPAQLIIADDAKFFSEEAKQKAKDIVAGSLGIGNRQVHFDTYESLSEEDRKLLEASKETFWNDWAKTKAQGNRGIEILICREPRHIHVMADKQMRDRGFGADKQVALKNAIIAHFKTGDFDGGLVAAAEYVKAEMPKDITSKGKDEQNKGGTSVGTWICLGICLLLGIWLVIGLIRAFSGGGMGGRGGGFGTALLGGLFGAMAGMWLYNSFFGGGHDSSAFGGEGGDTGGGGDAGAGDFGDAGTGGDWGGGGGDFGGGGDW